MLEKKPIKSIYLRKILYLYLNLYILKKHYIFTSSLIYLTYITIFNLFPYSSMFIFSQLLMELFDFTIIVSIGSTHMLKVLLELPLDNISLIDFLNLSKMLPPSLCISI
jgi:hypothetical protein